MEEPAGILLQSEFKTSLSNLVRYFLKYKAKRELDTSRGSSPTPSKAKENVKHN